MAQEDFPQSGATAHPAGSVEPALVVDLDGTLLRNDSLVECLLSIAGHRPAQLFALLPWLARGRARLKQRLAQCSALDISSLPFNQEVLLFLRMEKSRGRPIVLASGADRLIAQQVAQVCGIFDRVLASDGVVNLTGRVKRDRLLEEFGAGGYDYVGDSMQDLPVWAAARGSILVGPAPGLAAAAHLVARVYRVIRTERPGLPAWLEAMRWQHWLKNALLLVPLVFDHGEQGVSVAGDMLMGVSGFCLVASGGYLLNDLLDLGADRRHPYKKRRGLACGDIKLAHALVLMPALWGGAALLGLWLPGPFLAALAGYALLMLAYSLWLKHLVFVDALTLAIGYSLRVLAGALAGGLAAAPWLLACSTAMFFGLALLKRCAELASLAAGQALEVRVRAYRGVDQALITAIGAGACAGALVLLAAAPLLGPVALPDTALWLVCGLCAVWTGHMWRAAYRGAIHGDPVRFALVDPRSRLCGLLAVLVLVLAG